MIISHKHRFIFVHIHKCAGTSITRTLLPFLGSDDLVLGCTPKYEKLSNESRSKGSVYKHSTAADIREYVGENIWNDYFVFSFVRNPWDVVVSKYFWWHITPGEWDDSAKEKKRMIMSMTFDQYVRQKQFDANFSLAKFLRTDDSRGSDRNPFPDIGLIGKYESLQRDFSQICRHLGLPQVNLAMANRSVQLRKNRPFATYYNKETKEIVEHAYQDDIRLFGYSFPEPV